MAGSGVSVDTCGALFLAVGRHLFHGCPLSIHVVVGFHPEPQQVHYRCVLFGAAALRARNDWTLAIDMLDLMRCSGVDERASYHGVIKACRRVASTCKMWPALRVITGHIPKASSCQGIEGVSVLPKWWPISRMTLRAERTFCDFARFCMYNPIRWPSNKQT